MQKLLLVFLVFLGVLTTANANNVEITAVTVESAQITQTGTVINVPVSYDLSWENSWRVDVGPSNWDGVYVFARYRENNGAWNPLLVSTTATAPTAAGFTIQQARNGYIVYRNAGGSGDVSLNDLTFEGAFDDGSFDLSGDLEIRLFAIEMVYIPQGSYYLGSADSTFNNFEERLPDGTRRPFHVTSANRIDWSLNGSLGRLSIRRTDSEGGNFENSIPAAFPKGFRSFWSMKYEVSQQQYVDFFNTLQTSQKSRLDVTSSRGKNSDDEVFRNGISYPGGDSPMTTNSPFVAMNYTSSQMVLAYLDWAGLRPMSELEYTKICRGPGLPGSREYAWGTNTIFQPANALSVFNQDAAFERINGQSSTLGNAWYRFGSTNTLGPVRVGAVAASAPSPGRVRSGAAFYGVMDMSGNLSEWTVTVSTALGNALDYDDHGDGILGTFGEQSFFPSINADFRSKVASIRGGGFSDRDSRLRVADRFYGSRNINSTVAADNQANKFGFRGVLSLTSN